MKNPTVLVIVNKGMIESVFCDTHTVDVYIHDKDNPSFEEASTEYPHWTLLEGKIRQAQKSVTDEENKFK